MTLAGTPWHSSELALSLRNVGKTYRHFQLQNIDLDIPRGTVAGLIGPNGAGKSTLMRILMGLIHPDHGDVHVLGTRMAFHDSTTKREMGYFSDDMRIYKSESIEWHMQLVRSLYPSWDDGYAQELLSRFGLIAKQPIKGLSHGQRVKVMLLLILARRPQLLLLDEPTNGLDPVAKHEVLTELMQVVKDESRTILYSSHNTLEIEQICDSITFIDQGKVIESRSRDAFLEQWKRIKLCVPEGWAAPHIDGLKIVSTLRQHRVLSLSQYSETVPAVLTASGATLESIEPMSLEEIFVSSVMTGRERDSK